MYPQQGTGHICSLFGKSRQAWYLSQANKTQEMLVEGFVLKLVDEIRQDLPRIGTQKLHYMLQNQFTEHSIKLGRDKFYDLLQQHGYLLRYRKRKPYTTDSRHHFKKYPNLIRDLHLTGSGQLWVSDITYIRVAGGFMYLSLITDAYSHKIVGYCLWQSLESIGAINALEMAVKENKQTKELIHHSDRGVQYCCGEYVRSIEKSHIKISMTENGDPYENAIAERVNGILKTEFCLSNHFASDELAHQAVDNAVNMYNNRRPHASCDYLTPAMAHQATGELHKRWIKSKWSQQSQEINPQQAKRSDSPTLIERESV